MTVPWPEDAKDNIIRFFVIRHGQTDCNVKQILQGQKDIELNQTGFQQAEKLGKRLGKQSLVFDWVACSDLTRCKQTLDTILKASNQEVPITYYSELRERYLGVVEGMPIGEAEEYADHHNKKSFRDFGEQHKDFLDRLGTCFNSLAEKAVTSGTIKNVAVITHGGCIRILQEWLHYRARFRKVPNTSITIIDYNKDNKQFKVRILADGKHL